jgi:hypothetical protein
MAEPGCRKTIGSCGSCGECRYWTEYRCACRYLRGSVYDAQLLPDDVMPSTEELIARSDGDECSILTGPDFGCIHWEARRYETV